MDFLLSEPSTLKTFKIAGLALASLARKTSSQLSPRLFLRLALHWPGQLGGVGRLTQREKARRHLQRRKHLLRQLPPPSTYSFIEGLASLKLFKKNLELMFEDMDNKISDDEALLFELKNALESKTFLMKK